MNCKVCGYPAKHFARGLVLGKYDVEYLRCTWCGFVQTEETYWLDEAYSDAIAGIDVGLVSRNIMLSRVSAAVISIFFNADGRFLDYGGGYGLLVRMMRDVGLDYRFYDKHCPNLFAQGFESDINEEGGFELLTAFEVFEHLREPMEDIARMAGLSDNILFSTEPVPDTCPKPGEWWYYAPDAGQHIAFYTQKSLSVIAGKFGMNIYSHNGVHLMTRKRLPRLLFGLACSSAGSRIACLLLRRRSLLQKDWQEITGRI